jgi:hypothetical protein
VLLVWGAFSSPATAQTPAGSEFQVNTTTTYIQGSAAVASDVNGNFVVVWQGRDPAESGYSFSIFGQRFRASGVTLGVEFQVGDLVDSLETNPVAAMDARGRFVVVWESLGLDGSGDGVFGQRYDASGTPQGRVFQVNAHTTSDQFAPAVAAFPDGGFVVVWTGAFQDGSGEGVFGQRFDASGTALGAEFRINTFTTGHQAEAAVASAANGEFVVVWQSCCEDLDGYTVRGQRFDASGAPRGAEFQVNSYTTSYQLDAAVAADASGNFVVVWGSFTQDGDAYGVFGQRFAATGLPRGAEFRVNSHTTSYQTQPAVASDAEGGFVVVWTSYGQDGDNDGLFARSYDALGAPKGLEFRVNSGTTSSQKQGAVASNAGGDAVVVWQSLGQDGSGDGVFGQRYGDLIFQDGFEGPI